MAFGIGKAFKKVWKNTWGKVEDAIDPIKGTVVGALAGAWAGPAGMIIGASMGAAMDAQSRQQQKIADAQIASAEKIAAMQNQAVQVPSAPISTTQEAMMAEQNAGTAKKRAFSFARTQRMGSVARKNTLG